MLHALIMAGGSGTRFWPASRADQPKQLLTLSENQSMIQQTVSRISPLVPGERIQILTNVRLVAAIQEQLPSLPSSSILGEPCKRDTAPCIGLAALLLQQEDPEATMVVMPADHVISPTDVFCQAIEQAAQLVEAAPHQIVTFGISPSYPAESFGYIESGSLLDSSLPTGPPTYRVQQFHEKPALAIAEEYLEAGNFYWNSGIFVWKVTTILEALKTCEPTMYRQLEEIVAATKQEDLKTVLETRFPEIEGKSIDYAVMEKYSDVLVVEAPFQWSDMGNWQSLAALQETDENGNIVRGKHLAIESTNSIIHSTGDHLVVTIGLDDVIVVQTEDATLIVSKQEEEAVRQVVERLKERGWDEYL